MSGTCYYIPPTGFHAGICSAHREYSPTCNTCAIGWREPHDLGKTYWQVKVNGTWTDICETCHDEWLKHVSGIYVPDVNDRRSAEPAPSELPASSPTREELIEWRDELVEHGLEAIPFDVALAVWDLAIQAATVQCKRPGCDNEGRYDSNYCGIDDLIYNEGRGELRR